MSILKLGVGSVIRIQSSLGRGNLQALEILQGSNILVYETNRPLPTLDTFPLLRPRWLVIYFIMPPFGYEISGSILYLTPRMAIMLD